jgi:serine/threonine protein phosphatase PrpC
MPGVQSLSRSPGLFEPEGDWLAAMAVDSGLLAVACDGAGGMRHPGLAARRSAETFIKHCQLHFLEHACAPDGRHLQIHLARAMADLQGQLGEREMATTLTGLCLFNSQLRLYHVGDSRAYLFRQGNCVQLSRDHLAAPGHASNLSRALGVPGRDQLLCLDMDLLPGDRLLLATDGLASAGIDAVFLAELDAESADLLPALEEKLTRKVLIDQASLLLIDCGAWQ